MSEKRALPLIDAHAHIMLPHAMSAGKFEFPGTANARCMAETLEEARLKALCVPAITLFDDENLPCNPLALYAKTLAPGRIYALAGLRRHEEVPRNAGMLDELTRLLDMGFDGVKMICKPNVRKRMNIRIDDPVFYNFYGYMERNRTPLLFHVGDPAVCWDPGAPKWAADNGWYYGGDKEMPTYYELYGEAEGMLRRFPELNVTFAHFFFMSADLERAQSLFDRYPNARLDVTPGTDMYAEFTKDRTKYQDFFIKNKSRFIFGTDIMGDNGARREENMERIRSWTALLREYFVSENELEMYGTKVAGLNLPEDVCRGLFAGNFMNFIGGNPPKAVRTDAARALCEDYIANLRDGKEKTRETLLELEKTFARSAGQE